MAESTVGWFGAREKYYSLADKPWLISQIRSSEQAASQEEKALARWSLFMKEDSSIMKLIC